jgi:hypothetical protein
VLSVILLILSYWNSCRRQESKRRDRINKIKQEAVSRSRAGSFDSGSKNNSGLVSRDGSYRNSNKPLNLSDMNIVRQKLSKLSPQEQQDNEELLSLLPPVEIDHSRRKPLCLENMTPFSSVPNSRAVSRVPSRAPSPIQKKYYGSIEEEEIDYLMNTV